MARPVYVKFSRLNAQLVVCEVFDYKTDEALESFDSNDYKCLADGIFSFNEYEIVAVRANSPLLTNLLILVDPESGDPDHGDCLSAREIADIFYADL